MFAKRFACVAIIASITAVSGYLSYTWPTAVNKSYQGLVVSQCGQTQIQQVPVHVRGTLRRHLFREDDFKGRILVSNTPMEISSPEMDCSNFQCLYRKLSQREIRTVVHTRGHGRRVPAGTIVFTRDFSSIGGNSTFLSTKYKDPNTFFAAPARNAAEAERVFKRPM